MRGPAVQTIVIAAGGTGGHFFPAEALAAALIARGHRVVLMTDARSGGLKSPVFAGRETHVLPGAGIAGRGIRRGVKAVAGLAAGIVRARGLMGTMNVGAVVGFGGYPCVGPVLAARFLRRRPAVVLHEQNAVLGRANRFLSRSVDVLALNFARTERVPARMGAADTGARSVIIGNPVRPAIAALADAPYAPPTDTIRLLVIGGSLGARVFSDVVPAAIAHLPQDLRSRLSITQQCRAEDIERVRAAYAGIGAEADLSPFFPDIAERLAAAHLVVGRAGASTVAELAVTGRPSVLVPLPGAIDDHQSANARALAQGGAARVIPQSGFTAGALANTLTDLLSSPTMLAAMAQATRTQAVPDAAIRLADLVETLMTQQVRA